MFPLGHIGITIGIVYLLILLISSRNMKNNPRTTPALDIDFRIVIMAAMLADIIDKFVGMMILKEEISNGRIFTHSIVVIGIISISIFFVAKVKFGHGHQSVYYILPLWIHLLLDRMWEDTHTLFWPLYGTSFPRLDVVFSDYFSILLTNPYIFIGEILGVLIIVALVIRHRLFERAHLIKFLKDGKLKTHSDL